MSEWKKYKLGEIANFMYGRLPSKKMLGKGSYPIYSGYKYQDFYPEYNCEEEDVILVARGVGGTGEVKLTTQKCYLTNLSIKIDLDNSIILNKYFYYIYQRENLRYLDSGSAQSQITIQDLTNVYIEVPSIAQQKEIVTILSSLDDKIDLLSRENKTLEAMAETLFRQWFIEEAKEDWEEKSLLDCIKLIGGGTPKTSESSYWDGNICWLSGGDIANNHKGFVLATEKSISDEGLNNSSAKLLPENAMAVSARGTVGKYCLLSKPMAFSQSNYGIMPKYDNCFFFTYLLIAYHIDELQSAAYGSVFDTITTKTFEGVNVALPQDKDYIIEFEKMAEAYFSKMKNNALQIQSLAKTRDLLLSKLMSNEMIL